MKKPTIRNILYGASILVTTAVLGCGTYLAGEWRYNPGGSVEMLDMRNHTFLAQPVDGLTYQGERPKTIAVHTDALSIDAQVTFLQEGNPEGYTMQVYAASRDNVTDSQFIIFNPTYSELELDGLPGRVSRIETGADPVMCFANEQVERCTHAVHDIGYPINP